MAFAKVALLAGAASLPALAAAQYFPPTPEDVKVVKSQWNSDITISYKEPGICETTEGVKSYAGYVTLPPGTLEDVGIDQNYTINTFFWFFESRNDPANAPLSIWLNGGPGSSSMIGLMQENGPCHVLSDSNSTELNPWSWNEHVNMLYIDQPVQVGFSYDTVNNGTYDQTTGEVTLDDFANGVPEQNWTTLVGTFASNEQYASPNNTENSARSLWHFAQVWFQEFPAYKPNDDRISLWTESYGGRYGPSFAQFFEEQNTKIENGTITADGETYIIHFDTLGLINACIDLEAQEAYYPIFAYNNTYGIEAINETIYNMAMDAYYKSDGGLELMQKCRTLAAESDPNFYGNNDTVNAACQEADSFINNYVEGTYLSYGDRGYYDIAHNIDDPFPPEFFLGYLNQHWVQAALGVPLNYTESSNAVYYAFSSTGDYPRSDVLGYMEDIAYLLNAGVKVHLVYGDRDYACNWLGGENVSTHIPWSNNEKFKEAGYTDLVTNDTYNGGFTRQYGNFSFSRVFEAGHEVPAYQPETAYAIFNRSLEGLDIATGKIDTNSNANYSTSGPSSTFNVTDDVPPMPEPTCYVLDLFNCQDEPIEALLNGTAIVENYIIVGMENGTSFGNYSGGTGNSSSSGGSSGKKGAASTSSVSTSFISFVVGSAVVAVALM